MCGTQPSCSVALWNRFACGGAQERFAPKGQLWRWRSHQPLNGGLLNDVALQGKPEHQSRGPVGERRAQRHIQTVQAQPVAVIGPIRHGQSVHDTHVVSRVAVMPAMHVMPTLHVMAAVLAMRCMTVMAAVCLVPTALVVFTTTLALTVVSVCAMPIRVAFSMLAALSVITVCLVRRLVRGRAAFGVRGVSSAVVVRFMCFVRGVVGDAGVRGVGLSVVTVSVLV